MRRFHKKSRLGCKQCKLRRSKCDEARPRCGRCSLANQQCSFLIEAPTLPSHTLPPPDLPLDESYGSIHLRLLHHFQNDMYHDTKSLHPGLKDVQGLFIQEGFAAPYLMDELLAYSAAHKSTLNQRNSRAYSLEATRLQTRALACYKVANTEISESTCLPMFIFSSLLSHHIIFCMGASARSGLDDLIDYLIRSVVIHRGLIAIAKASWPMFPEQTQQRLIRSCKRDCMPIPSAPDSRGEFDALLGRLRAAAAQEKSSVETLCRTVEALQDRFDAIRAHDSHAMWAAVQDWLVAIPGEYIELLNQREPLALVVLAHFGVLLYRVAEHWFVGDLGMRLIGLVGNYLGPGWDEWLEWPNRTRIGHNQNWSECMEIMV